MLHISVTAIATMDTNVGCEYKFLNLYKAWCLSNFCMQLIL
jgi:hypothetical protein